MTTFQDKLFELWALGPYFDKHNTSTVHVYTKFQLSGSPEKCYENFLLMTDT